jgi:beta-ureidopropionase
MGQRFRVAGVQMACRVGDVKGNVERGCSWVKKAAQEGAHLVCLPEMFNTGYFSHTSHVDTKYWDLAEPLQDSWTLHQMGTLAKRHGLHVVAPIVEKGDLGIYHNSAVVIGPEGDMIGCYRKVHLPWSFTGWEKFYFRPGYDFPVFDTSLVRLGIQICYDRDFPEGFRTLALKGAQLILLPTGAPRHLVEMWRLICRIRAYENGVFVLGVGLTGKVDEEHHEFTGNTILADPRGNVLGLLGYEEGLLLAEIDLQEIEEARKQRFGLRDRRPELYGKITELI